MADWMIMLRDKVIKRFSLGEGDNISIGRGKDCDITIDNTAISRRHISISLNSGIYFVSDLGSTNGTFVNGKKISKDEPVSENDNIEFGKFALSINHQDENKQAPVSTAADSLDIDDETVFVSNNRPQVKKQIKPKQAGPQLTILQGGNVNAIPLAGKGSVKIGKSPSCDLILSGWFIAPAQCYIIRRDKGFYIVPQKSWVATLINGKKISGERLLRPGDIIKIRQNTIRFE
jgi:pSer/pThr/pTyr-binding forkhead associated (FHA) protein